MNAQPGPFAAVASTSGAPAAQTVAVPAPPATTEQIQQRYGVMAWYGHHTRGYWALVDGEGLVEAPDAAGLGPQITAARGRIAASRFAPAARPQR